MFVLGRICNLPQLILPERRFLETIRPYHTEPRNPPKSRRTDLLAWLLRLPWWLWAFWLHVRRFGLPDPFEVLQFPGRLHKRLAPLLPGIHISTPSLVEPAWPLTLQPFSWKPGLTRTRSLIQIFIMSILKKSILTFFQCLVYLWVQTSRSCNIRHCHNEALLHNPGSWPPCHHRKLGL